MSENKVDNLKFKKILLDQKQHLLLRANNIPVIDSDGDEVDEVQANLLIEMASQFSSRDINKIALIDKALGKIKDDTYGLCDDCDECIPEKRLLVNPYFETCILCAEKRELELRQIKRWWLMNTIVTEPVDDDEISVDLYQKLSNNRIFLLSLTIL